MSISSGETVIIGAGSTGTSIAYSMIRSGMKVNLVDMNGVASGNTGKSSGLVRSHYSNETVARMAKFSHEVLSNFSEIGYSGYTKTGMVYAFPEADIQSEKRNVDMLKRIGVEIGEIESDRLKSFYDPINMENFDYITFEPESGYADPVATSNSFASRARELGATININKKAKKIKKDESGTRVYFSDGTERVYDRVVMATNIWTNKLLRDSGVDESDLLPINASRHNVIYLRRPHLYAGPKPVLWDMAQLSYYKMEGDIITAVGSLDPELDKIQTDSEEEIFDEASEEFMEKYLGNISRRLPYMENAEYISTVSGRYDMTPDGEPIIDELFHLGLGDVYVCAGLSGHGFKLSPAIGNIVSDMIQGKKSRDCMFDWGIFNRKRFTVGRLIGKNHEDIGTLY